MKDKNFMEILKKHGKTNPEIASAVEYLEGYKLETESLRDDLVIENIKLMKEAERDGRRINYFRHEIINSLGATEGLLNLLFENYEFYNDDDRKELIGTILQSAKKGNNLTGFLYSANQSKRQYIIPEQIALNDAPVIEKDTMIPGKIGLNIRYQSQFNQPKLYVNLADFEAIFGTLNSNWMAWTPEKSRAEMGIRIDKNDNLEILCENKGAIEKVRNKGMGKGYGEDMLKTISSELGGEYHKYSKSQILKHLNEYNKMERYGYKKATDHITENDEIYGVEIKIPMKNLRE